MRTHQSSGDKSSANTLPWKTIQTAQVYTQSWPTFRPPTPHHEFGKAPFLAFFASRLAVYCATCGCYPLFHCTCAFGAFRAQLAREVVTAYYWVIKPTRQVAQALVPPHLAYSRRRSLFLIIDVFPAISCEVVDMYYIASTISALSFEGSASTFDHV